METQETIAQRRSIRQFKPQAINRSIVKELLAAAILAPSSHNSQPWHFVVVNAKEVTTIATLLETASLTHQSDSTIAHTAGVLKSANVLILVFYENQAQNKDQYEMELQSIGCALENLCLAATDRGIGSLYVGNTYVIKEALTEKYAPNTHMSLVATIALGYPDQAPNMRPRKKLEQVCTWHWKEGE